MKIKSIFVFQFVFMIYAHSQHFQWQGHRGCRGLLPENTLPAFLHALEYPHVTALELDVVITADKKVLISHEAWMNHEICSLPDGSPVSKEAEKLFNIYKMRAAEVQTFDCGMRGHKRFPLQKAMTVHKPLLTELVEALRQSRFAFPFLNIEIKTEGPKGDNNYHPEPKEFVQIVLQEIRNLNIENKVSLQSFDTRILQEIKNAGAKLPLGLLVENKKGLRWNLNKLGFVPDFYNCKYSLLDKETVEKCHAMNISVITWTVNTENEIKAMKAIGVDGIITDYPNLAN